MIVKEFFDKYNDKGIDFDGYYGYQCMDLAHQYAVEVVGHDIPAVPGAKDEWDHDIEGYDKIPNTPDNVPTQGDIVIWGTGVGAFGHIAVFDHGDTNSFVSFDQNWPLNSLCHLQNHNYNGVLGWFHPQNSATITQEIAQPVVNEPEITNQTKIPQIGNQEVQAIVSKINDDQNMINSLNAQIANLNSELLTAKSIIGQLQTKLATLQNTPIEPQTPPQLPTTPQTGLWASLRKLFGL